MRSLSGAPRARSVLAALALLVVTSVVATSSPAVAKEAPAKPKKAKKPPRVSVTSCTQFDQRDTDDGVELVVASSCEIALSCQVSWAVTCAPGTRKASTRRQAEAFELEPATDHATAATADCGDRGWEITDISWSCAPRP
jgi:hypothetical protein